MSKLKNWKCNYSEEFNFITTNFPFNLIASVKGEKDIREEYFR
jgi:hypothetical protein